VRRAVGSRRRAGASGIREDRENSDLRYGRQQISAQRGALSRPLARPARRTAARGRLCNNPSSVAQHNREILQGHVAGGLRRPAPASRRCAVARGARRDGLDNARRRPQLPHGGRPRRPAANREPARDLNRERVVEDRCHERH